MLFEETKNLLLQTLQETGVNNINLDLLKWTDNYITYNLEQENFTLRITIPLQPTPQNLLKAALDVKYWLELINKQPPCSISIIENSVKRKSSYPDETLLNEYYK